MIGPTRPLGARRASCRDRVPHSATATRGALHAVATRRSPQRVQGSTTAGVAKGTSGPAGVPQARARVRHQAGKAVECGLPSLLSRLGGGALCGTMIRGGVDEAKRPWQARAGSRALCGAQAPPTLMVSARGGSATAPLRALANEGGKARGRPPKGPGTWGVAAAVRETVSSERGTPEGILGTLKTDQDGFNKPQERLWQTLEMAGPRSLLACNLPKRMRDLRRAARGGDQASGPTARTPQRPSRDKREAKRPP